MAISLRKKGKTYTDISRIMRISFSKSTLSVWFKNIELSAHQTQILNRHVSRKLKRSQKIGLKSLINKRVEFLETIVRDNFKFLDRLDLQIQKIILSILYLGEGSKFRSTRNLRIGNSNPKIIQLFLKLLQNCYKIDTKKLRFRIQCRYDQNIHDLERYWKEIVNIPHVRFYPSYKDKRTLGKPTFRHNYYGVCTVNYFDTKIQLDLEILSNLIMEMLLGNKINNKTFIAQWLNPSVDGKIS